MTRAEAERQVIEWAQKWARWYCDHTPLVRNREETDLFNAVVGYNTLIAQGDALPADAGWRLVSVELPPIGQYVLIYRPANDRKPVCEAVRLILHQDVAPWYWSTPITAHGDGDMVLPESVTKWCPLPSSPKTQEEKRDG